MTHTGSPPKADRLYYEYVVDGWVYVYFQYDPTIVEAIKHAAPSHQRRWSPDHRRWEINEAFWGRVKRVLVACGVLEDGDFEHLGARAGKTGSAWSALHLTPGAPPTVVDAAYRAMAKLHHPDMAEGDADRAQRTQRMTALNLAYEKLRPKT